MNSPKGEIQERPAVADFESGWQIFLEVIKVLKPTHCLFVGVSAFYSFENAMNAIGLKYSVNWSDEKIGTAYGRIAELVAPPIKLIGIQHAGKYFSWAKWHEFIKKHFPDIVDRLKKQIAA